MNLRFALGYAIRRLRRGGQRTVLALLCIAFGVMSLTALQLLATSARHVILVDPRLELGGDLTLRRPNGQLTDADLAAVDDLKQDGLLQATTPVERLAGGLIKHGGRIYQVRQILGVDPASYPLIGEVRLRSAREGGLSAALAVPGNVVITRDIADEFGLRAGDALMVSAGFSYPLVPLQVGDIADITPDTQGDLLLVTLATTRHLAGADRSNQQIVALADVGAATPKLEGAGWQVGAAQELQGDESRQQAANVFNFMLIGAGLLGLLIGGIGVATTIQALIASRQTEIATLKALGYQSSDLLLLFGSEAALLGLVGSLPGVAVAVALSGGLTRLFERTGSMLLSPTIEPSVLLSGILAGVATAVIVALYPISAAMRLRPASLLRSLPEPAPAVSRWRSAGLLAGLSLLYGLLCSLVMGSLLMGIGVIVLAIVGLTTLGGLLLGALNLALLAPLPGGGMVALARTNVRRQRARSIVAMVALVCGLFTIGFVGTSVASANARVEGRAMPLDGYNLAIFADPPATERLQRYLLDEGAREIHMERQTHIAQALGPTGLPLSLPAAVLHGLPQGDAGWNIQIVEGAPLGSQPEAAYLPRLSEENAVQIGDQIQVMMSDGRRYTLPIAGFYTWQRHSGLGLPVGGVLVSAETAQRIGGPATRVMLVGQAPSARLDEIAQAINRAAPLAIVISTADLNAFLQRALHDLFSLVVAIAGLALAAGAALIANSVGLALVERRRELGVLKAIGYSRRHVFRLILVENGLLGLLSGLVAMALVVLAIAGINLGQPAARLIIQPALILGMTGMGIGLAVVTTTLVAWRPTGRRPMDVLRTE